MANVGKRFVKLFTDRAVWVRQITVTATAAALAWVVGDLLSAEIADKQARSIKYQVAVAKLPLAKDIEDFVFDGTPINETLVRDLAGGPGCTLLCGRFEGVDQRVLDAHGFEEVSIGDYILSGGEPLARSDWRRRGFGARRGPCDGNRVEKARRARRGSPVRQRRQPLREL